MSNSNAFLTSKEFVTYLKEHITNYTEMISRKNWSGTRQKIDSKLNNPMKHNNSIIEAIPKEGNSTMIVISRWIQQRLIMAIVRGIKMKIFLYVKVAKQSAYLPALILL